MRKLLMAGLMAMSLVGCTTTQVQQIETFIGQVQADAAAVCKFIPTVATIIGLVNGGFGQVVGPIVQAICNAVPPPATAKYRSLPRAGLGLRAGSVGTINGVVINGWRV